MYLRNLPVCLGLVLGALALCVLSPGARAEDLRAEVRAADEAFEQGRLREAGELYAKILKEDPDNFRANQQAGYLALLGNRLAEAQKLLAAAQLIKPDDLSIQGMLAEVYYRQDKFAKAAPLLRAVGKEARARKLESFHGQDPYDVQSKADSTTLPFLMTDPLPLVKVRVNGKEAIFFLDTGGSEVVLDEKFAKELNVPLYGTEEGTFSGGHKAPVGHSRVNFLKLGDWDVKNVPVATLKLRGLSDMFDGKRIDGILGTVLFYHFVTTIDYPGGKLVLQRKPEPDGGEPPLEAPRAQNEFVVPFWMADDHFMVAHGSINQRPEQLFFIDSGLAGGGVKLAESVIKAANIKLQEDEASEGAGGAGELRIVPFTVEDFSLGPAKQRNVPGVFDGPFPWEKTFGFELAGMVGHDFLRVYTVTFDFDRMEMTLAAPRANSAQKAPLPQ